MFCKNCGKELTDGMNVCVGCGCDIEDTRKNSSKAENIGSPKKKKKKLLIIICVAIAAVILIFYVGSSDETSLPEDSTQKSSNVNVDGLSAEEKIIAWSNAGDIKSLAAFGSECEEENKKLYKDEFEKAFLNYLSVNRAKLYSHNPDYIELLSEMLGAFDKNIFSDNESMLHLLSLIEEITEKTDAYRSYLTSLDLYNNCDYFDGKITQRIENADADGEYLDEYLFEYYGLYDDWTYIIIESEDTLQKGVYSGYLKYVTTEEDYVSEGFDYTFDIYRPMTDKEVQEYLNIADNIDKMSEEYNYTNSLFEDINDIVNDYAKKNPIRITDDSYIATYVGGYGNLPFDYLHTLTLNEDFTFDITVNIYEGMADYSGTYTKEGNVITCQSDDLYFELVMTEDSLVYHNLLDYGMNCIEESEHFVK